MGCMLTVVVTLGFWATRGLLTFHVGLLTFRLGWMHWFTIWSFLWKSFECFWSFVCCILYNSQVDTLGGSSSRQCVIKGKPLLVVHNWKQWLWVLKSQWCNLEVGWSWVQCWPNHSLSLSFLQTVIQNKASEGKKVQHLFWAMYCSKASKVHSNPASHYEQVVTHTHWCLVPCSHQWSLKVHKLPAAFVVLLFLVEHQVVPK